jgi:hypothetical protein
LKKKVETKDRRGDQRESRQSGEGQGISKPDAGREERD